MDEIQNLIDEYNAAEDEQQQRLARLFLLIAGRFGYRHVKFGVGHMWSNCWEHETQRAQEIALERHVDPLTMKITDVVRGAAR